MADNLSRRSFLKAGLFGAVALAAAGGVYRITRPVAAPSRFALDEAARSVLGAIVPVMLQGVVAPFGPDVQTAITRVVDAVSGLPLATQKEIQDLFALLSLGAPRRFLAGVRDDWPSAKAEDVHAFLQDWRYSRFEMLQSAYHGLHDLILGSWYADESTWASIGYPGPIKELS